MNKWKNEWMNKWKNEWIKVWLKIYWINTTEKNTQNYAICSVFQICLRTSSALLLVIVQYAWDRMWNGFGLFVAIYTASVWGVWFHYGSDNGW